MATRCDVCGEYPIRGAVRTFFPWPTDPSQRTYWQTCLGVQDLNLNKPELFICSDHFDQMQMIRKGTALRKDAFPKRYDGPLPTFLEEDGAPKVEPPSEDVKNEDVGIFDDPGPSAPVFDDEEIMPEELSMAKLVQMFAAAAKERPTTIAPFVTPISEETRAFSNILIDRQEKYLETYCKSCLRQAELVNMLEANCEGVPVTLMYKAVFMTEITPSDVPQLMCHTCIGLLFQCFKFSTMSARSCEVLQAARERFKYLSPLDDGTIDLKNIPDKYSAKPCPRPESDVEDQKDDVKVVKRSVKKRKSVVKSKEVPPEKKGRRTSTRRASEQAKKVSKKILEDSDEDDSNNDNFDNDEADPDFDAQEVKDESPEVSDAEVEEKEEDKDDQDPEDNYCMLCRHQFSNMARHMDKVHRVDWESKSCERTSNIKLKKPKREKLDGKEEKALEKPKKKVHKKASSYTCLKCKTSSNVFKNMFDHLQRDHKNDLDCIFCGDSFDHEIQLLDHIGEHGPRIYCRIHFIAFETGEEWLKHVREPAHSLHCGICHKMFKTRSGRNNHRNRTHLKSEQEIKCPLCPLVYGCQTNLQRHVKTFHEKRSYLCENCGSSFSTNHALKLHTAQKHNKGYPVVGPIQCEYCGKIFADGRCVKAHKAKHFGQTEMCQYCGKFFDSEEKLKEHVEALNHHLYQCDLCSMTFKRKSFYLSHLIKTHNINLAKATIQVSIQRKGFKMMKKKRIWKYTPSKGRKKNNPNDPMGRLVRGTERPDVKVINGKKHYVCLVCNKMFLSDSNLARHKELHSDIKYQCQHCSKVFAQKQGLQKHMAVHSGERPFVCKICGKRYKDSCTLGKHKKIHGKSALIGINSVSLSPRRKKASKISEQFLNPSYYALPHLASPQNYVVSDESNEGLWFSRDVNKGKTKLKRSRKEKRDVEEENSSEKANKKVYKKSSAFTCLKCKMSSKVFKKMFDHLQSDHKNDLDCIFCGDRFDHEIQLLDHLSDHGPRIYCRIHFIAFDSSEEWLKHVREPTHPMQCGICEKVFKTRSGRDNHRIHTHLRPEQEIKCPQCPMVYGSRTNLRRHIRTFHEKRFYLCEDCGASFSTNHALKLHTAQKHNKGPVVGPIQCEYCGRIFADARCLKAHKAKHFGQTEMCQYCGQFFESEEKLKEHVEALKHHLYQCDLCSTTFKRKTFYMSHLLKSHNITMADAAAQISMERKSFKMMKKKRVWKYAPKKGRKKNNPDDPRGRLLRGTDRPDVKVINGKRHYVCLVCDKMFLNDSNLARHKELHSDIKYKCQHCSKVFAQKQGLQKHMPVHSDERPFECKICGKRYKDSCTLGKHKRIHGKSALIGINSVSLSPRRKKVPKISQDYLNPSYYALPHVVSPQNYVGSEESNEGRWFSRDANCQFKTESSKELFQHLLEKEIIKCTECHLEFDHKIGIQRHLKLSACGKRLSVPGKKPSTKQIAASIFVCNQCVYHSNSFKKMFTHIQDDHKNTLACALCDDTFDNEYLLLFHYKKHGKDKYCEQHFRAFNTREELANHRKAPGHYLQCPICSITFTSKEKKSNHIQKVHRSKPKVIKQFLCSECPLMFELCGSYHRHVETAHRKRIFLCEDCGRPFTTNTMLRQHQATEHKKGKKLVHKTTYQCETCGEQLRQIAAFRAHKAMHLGHTKFCGYCHETFENVEALDQHVKASGHSWAECHKCSGIFKTKTRLSVHLLRCDGTAKKQATDKPKRVSRPKGTIYRKLPNGRFACNECNMEFTNQGNAGRHYYLHLGKTFSCNICGKKFGQKMGLTAHLPVHSDERPYKCQVCDAAFKDRSTWYKHRKVHTAGTKSAHVGKSTNLRSKRTSTKNSTTDH